ncbi:MAG: hypothetical protein GX437_00560 [Sphingobacteriales bacterium]|nr:hypothetical protein [Sphingobacteriales bacterium]
MRKLFIFFIVISLFISCKKEQPDWSPRILLPLVNSEIGLDKLISDSTLKLYPDSSLFLVSDFSLGEFSFTDLMKIPDTTLIKKVTLKTIKIGTRIIESKVTLGEVARKNGLMGQLILNAHGSYLPVPPIPGSNGGKELIDASSLFQSVEVQEGQLEANIFNGLPIELQDVIFLLRNKNSGEILLQDTVVSVMPKTNFVKVYPLNGKKFEGLLESEILNISSPGTGTTPVLIDTNDAININLKVKIDKVNSATAIFPAQNLVDTREDVEYVLEGIKLNFMKIKSGIFRVVVASTLQDSGFITYSIPSARYKGEDSLVVNVVLPPAPKGDTVFIDRSYPVDDYWFDLTGKDGDKYNSFYHHLLMRIDSTGKMMDLSLNDSIYLLYTLYDVIPEYLSGYLGNDSFVFSGNVSDLGFFKNIKGGSIDLEKLDIGFFIENGVGAKARITIDKVEAINSQKGESIILTGTNLAEPIDIQSANDNPFYSVRTSKPIQNSNAEQFVELLPDQANYQVKVFINPDGQVSYNDFIYRQSKVKAGIQAELPLHFSSKGLSIIDTVDFVPDNVPETEMISSARLKVLILNKFPVKSRIQLVFLDENLQVIDSLFKIPVEIAYPEYTGNKNYVPAETKFEIPLENHFIRNFENIRKVIVLATLDTGPGDTRKKIFSDYKISVRINGDFILKPKL